MRRCRVVDWLLVVLSVKGLMPPAKFSYNGGGTSFHYRILANPQGNNTLLALISLEQP